MKLFKILIRPLFALALVSCAINLGVKLTPDYKEVDPKLAPYADNWLYLAKSNGLIFNKNITMGFKDIDRGLVIGQCREEIGFREIDIDKKYWEFSSEISRASLVYHELSHCACGRHHDYYIADKVKEYGDDAKEAIKDPSKKDGFFDDGCPKSVMFPQILSDECVMFHYKHYQKEMFEHCDPY